MNIPKYIVFLIDEDKNFAKYISSGDNLKELSSLYFGSRYVIVQSKDLNDREEW